jgi:CO/xanthine dehydrogenase Mo-binding subunit
MSESRQPSLASGTDARFAHAHGRIVAFEMAPLAVPAERDIRGASGAKSSVGPEERIVAGLARELQVTVKWPATRTEEFSTDILRRHPHSRSLRWQNGRLQPR